MLVTVRSIPPKGSSLAPSGADTAPGAATNAGTASQPARRMAGAGAVRAPEAPSKSFTTVDAYHARSRAFAAPGVHFGLAEAAYHADPALGSTDIKALAVSPTDFWARSKMNPERDDDDTPARFRGRAIHKLVLEGEGAYAKAYAVEPAPEDHPGCLVKQADLKGHAKALGLAVGGTNADLIKRIREVDTTTPIFAEIEEAFAALAAKGQISPIKRRIDAEVRRVAAAIRANPVYARAFEGGASEVSVFWTDADGVPLKCRFDYLKPFAILDLKSFSNSRCRPVGEAIRSAIAEYRYDMAAAHYLDGWEALLEAVAAKAVHGACPLPAGWSAELVPADEVAFVWMFLQSEGAPVARAIEVSRTSAALARARADVAEARAAYLNGLRRHGLKPWIDETPIEVLTFDDLPRWLTARVAAPALA